MDMNETQALAALTELWQPNIRLPVKRRFATLGAGVAAGLGPLLEEAGYRWANTEPAPRGLSVQNARQFNYDVFSCRTGAITSAAVLHQWVAWALGHSTPPDVVWEFVGRSFDPFRPMIEPDGFATPTEVLSTRALTLAALKKALEAAGVLVIVLDGVESWQDKATEVEYPACAEIFAEAYHPESHDTKSRPYPAVVKSLKETIAMLQRANKNIRILLGVNGPDFAAATYSKDPAALAACGGTATLRAAMGQLAATQKGVAYLPVYEMALQGTPREIIQCAVVERLQQLAPPQGSDGPEQP